MAEQLNGYLSDESSFYGDDDVKASLEARAEAVDVEQSWILKTTTPSITEIAEMNIAKNMAIEKTTKTTQLYNPYKGIHSARQLGETVDQFLARIPPASTLVSEDLHWIWIANPFIPRPGSIEDPDGEDGYNPDKWAKFEILGRNLLEELKDDIDDVTKEMGGQPQLQVTKAQNRLRDTVVTKLKEMAAEMKCTSGKWLLFVSPSDVNDVWAVVARATAVGDLGIAAKVAPGAEDDRRNQRVICVYTGDFNDLEDVKRVVAKLKDLGCITMKGRNASIYYKADAYTRLHIESGNEWSIKPSLYSSADMLGKNQQKMDGFLKRKL